MFFITFFKKTQVMISEAMALLKIAWSLVTSGALVNNQNKLTIHTHEEFCNSE